MAHSEWDDLGEQIQNIVNNAVRERNYASLNESINDVLDRAIDSGSDALKSVLDGAFKSSSYSRPGYGQPRPRPQQPGYSPNPAPRPQPGYNPEHNARAYETHTSHGYQTPPFGQMQNMASQVGVSRLYASTSSPKLKGTGMAVVGGLLALDAIGSLPGYFFGALFGSHVSGMGLTLAFGALGFYLLYKGMSTLRMVKRFSIYRKSIGQKTYAQLNQLGALIGKPVSFVAADVRKMIKQGWFTEGHVDDDNTTLMVSNETYQQYLASRDELKARKEAAEEEEKAKKKAKEKEEEQAKVSKEVQEVLDKGNAYLKRLHEANEAIPGEEISAKISRMELLVQRIFDRVKVHPEVIPDLKKMMNYYLPTTVKLLEAYQEMDAQPVQGENIRKSKTEIESTIDTLITAFEKLLDSIFQDTAWDVSSDISVLNTMLAQEGLTKGDFERV